jgi:hypothetical protein
MAPVVVHNDNFRYFPETDVSTSLILHRPILAPDLPPIRTTEQVEEVIAMKTINDVVVVLRNMVDKWREFTFAGMVRIEFPSSAPAPRETSIHRARLTVR